MLKSAGFPRVLKILKVSMGYRCYSFSLKIFWFSCWTDLRYHSVQVLPFPAISNSSLRGLDSLQSFQFHFGSCGFVFSGCYSYSTCLILGNKGLNKFLEPWKNYFKKNIFSLKLCLHHLSQEHNGSCAKHSISRMQMVFTASPTWKVSSEWSPALNISISEKHQEYTGYCHSVIPDRIRYNSSP